MRFLLSLVLILLAVAAALGSGATAMLSRNVLDTAGFNAAVVATVRSPAGLALVRTSVENEVLNRAAAQPAVIARGAATVAGDWAVRALQSGAAPRIVGPVAVGLQQGILTGTERGVLQFDLRAFATAVDTPPVVDSLLAAVSTDLLVTVPWVQLSPGAQTVLQELDRHRWLPTALAVAALVLGACALLVSRRRGVALVLLGALLAAGAWFLRPVATDVTEVVVAARASETATGPLAATFVGHVFDGWTAVSGALVAIGLALILVGAVFGLRRSGR